MESSSLSSSASRSTQFSLSYGNYFILFFIRPILAVSFAASLLFLGWFLAWKLVLVHVPLVQEIFGLRKKPVKPKPENRRRLTRFYNSIDRKAVDRMQTVFNSIATGGVDGSEKFRVKFLP